MCRTGGSETGDPNERGVRMDMKKFWFAVIALIYGKPAMPR